MIGTVLDKVAGHVDQRLLSTLLFPCFLFLAGVGALIATTIGWTTTLTWWSSLDSARRALLVGAGVAGLLLLSTVVSVQMRSLIQIYEGFWRGFFGSPLASIAVDRQARRLDRLPSDEAGIEQRYYGFPPAGVPLLATRLGNALRAAESYPEARYGTDGVFFWPRLYVLLPEATQNAVASARSNLERQLVTATLAGAFAVVSAGFAVFASTPVSIWLPAVAGSALLAWAAYRGAVAAALAFGDLIRSAYDLYRRTLLKTMGLTPPPTLDEERRLWTALGQQLYYGLASEPELLRFTTPSDDEDSGGSD